MTQIRHSILVILSIVAIALAAVMVILAPHNRALAQPGHESPGFHGMLVLGSERIYASHLPMFTAQHRYQGIWQVTFGDAGDQAYRDAQAANDGEIFTLAPNESFRLPELTGPRGSFRADVYVGHFERPGHRKLLDDVTVTLEQQVHWHPFLSGHKRPEQLTYLLFGDGEEIWLAHWISAAPDYDQIVKVTPVGSGGPLPALAQVVVPDRDDAQTLRPGDTASVLLLEDRGSDKPIRVTPIDLSVETELYLEQRELSFSELGDEPSQ
jgi:hypothetical protein